MASISSTAAPCLTTYPDAPGAECFLHVYAVGLHGYENHAGIHKSSPDLAGGLNAVESGHADVQQQNVGAKLLISRDRRTAVHYRGEQFEIGFKQPAQAV